MINKALYSSKNGSWETPRNLFDELNREFNFTLDACAPTENTKCPTFYTEQQDGLSMPWTGRVWCNPPYGRKIGKWVEKPEKSAEEGATVVMLIPARTDTAWFHDHVYHKAEIRFIRSRICFELDGLPILDKNGRPVSAPFPSMICVFRPGQITE